MLLHYNAACPHGDKPTTPLRIMCSEQRYQEALAEIARLNRLELDPLQRLVTRAYQTLVMRKLHRISSAQMRERLAELSIQFGALGDDEMVADFRCLRIGIAGRNGDRALASDLISHFFDDIPRTILTEAMWRIAQGSIERPRDAIRHYVTAVTQLQGQNLPCLLEMAARFLANSLCALGDRDEAIEVLRRVGLPASQTPGEGEIPLADLLVLPLM